MGSASDFKNTYARAGRQHRVQTTPGRQRPDVIPVRQVSIPRLVTLLGGFRRVGIRRQHCQGGPASSEQLLMLAEWRIWAPPHTTSALADHIIQVLAERSGAGLADPWMLNKMQAEYGLPPDYIAGLSKTRAMEIINTEQMYRGYGQYGRFRRVK